MVGYTPSSFADLVFAGEMIEVGLKRGKSDHHALIKCKSTTNYHIVESEIEQKIQPFQKILFKFKTNNIDLMKQKKGSQITKTNQFITL